MIGTFTISMFDSNSRFFITFQCFLHKNFWQKSRLNINGEWVKVRIKRLNNFSLVIQTAKNVQIWILYLINNISLSNGFGRGSNSAHIPGPCCALRSSSRWHNYHIVIFWRHCILLTKKNLNFFNWEKIARMLNFCKYHLQFVMDVTKSHFYTIKFLIFQVGKKNF